LLSYSKVSRVGSIISILPGSKVIPIACHRIPRISCSFISGGISDSTLYSHHIHLSWVIHHTPCVLPYTCVRKQPSQYTSEKVARFSGRPTARLKRKRSHAGPTGQDSYCMGGKATQHTLKLCWALGDMPLVHKKECAI
jgi:hypothetical protein